NSLEPCTKEETRTEQVLVKPAVPGTPGTPGTPEIPGKPAVTRSERYVKTPARAAVKESNPVIGTFQVDTYRPKTAAQAKVVARLDDDGMLTYREDKALWGASTYEFVTVTAKDVKSTGSLAKAIDAKARKVGNISAGPVMSARA
ncbi:hypothetical protein, partial [Collinsella sp. Sow4_E3]|uniref:hypothetical protein n=1 Tax=Collinsella sp. Sow4_E3 TaxID=3438776 RepID=UPI003F90DC23